MSFISNNRNQLNLLGYSLVELVPKHAKCKFIISLVEKMNLKRLYNRYSSQGQPAYDPATILATWFLAYCEGETRTRKVEQLCRRDLHYMYISSNLQPDHSSLSRFRKSNIDLMEHYFIQLIRLIKKRKIAEFKDIAIDGTKIQASCSRSKSRTEGGISREIARMRQQIRAYLKECDEADQEETAELSTIHKKIKDLKEKENELVELAQEIKERKKHLKSEHRSNHKINITEPEAYLMGKVNGNQKLPGYNAQVSVDTQTQIIAANDIVQDRNDSHQFKNQHRQVEDNLGADAEREYTTDSGYHSLEQLEYVEANQIKAIIADKNERTRSKHKNSSQAKEQENPASKEKFERADFIYHKAEDFYECPAGEKLIYKEKVKHRGRRQRKYRCYECTSCIYNQRCLPRGKVRYRQILRDEREDLAEQMYQRTQTEYGKQKLKQRSCSVEGVFGNLKENLGFRRFRLRGLASVRGEFNLMCISHNINKMLILFIRIFLHYYYIQIVKEQKKYSNLQYVTLSV